MKTTPMLGGDAGTAQTVAQMKSLVNQSLTDPVVVETARGLAAQNQPRDTDSQAETIKSYLSEHFMFVRDPNGVELLSTPRFMLDSINNRMYAQGDCDEAAILAAALGKAIGLQARFILLGFSGPTGPMAHVFTLLRGRSGWHNLDVTRPSVGFIPPATRVQEVEV